MLKFVLSLPPKSVSDVVSRELSVSVGGRDPMVVTLAGDVQQSEELSGADGETVSGTLVDIDDNGNRSEPREFSFVLMDTLAPPMPGDLGVNVVAEE
jgi:hypothetical protein